VRRSEILVGRGCRLVYGVLGGLLGVADGLLGMALGFLNGAFTLHLVGTDGFANALFGLADGFIGGALDLVCRCTHGNSPSLCLSLPRQVSNTAKVPSIARLCEERSDEAIQSLHEESWIASLALAMTPNCHCGCFIA
jgi:hypothetical protein